MPSDLSAEQLGHLTMFTDDYDAVVAQVRAAQGDEVVRLGGLCVHFAPAEPGGAIARERAYWPDDNPLGLTGDPTIKVAAADPKQAAADLASQAGRPDYHADRGHLNAVAYGVRFGGHAVEFLGSASGGDHDLVGGFLAGHGPGIFSTTYLVRDFGAARTALAAQDIRFTQWGRHSLLLRPESAPGARIELTDEG
jgi:hypothetical protein